MQLKKICKSNCFGVVILKFILLILCGAVIGTLFLMFAYKLPLNRENVEASLAQQEQMKGSYPIVNKNSGNSYFNSYEPGVLDDNTDWLILQKTFDEGEGSLLWRVMYMQGYGRYWHGYISLLRPLFYFVDYFDFRILNGMAQILLIVVLAILVWQKMGKKRYVLALLTSYGLLMPVALSMSLQYSPVFYISFLGSLIVLRKGNYLLEKSRYLYFFLILGMLVCYFDFLTYPLVAWAFPLCWLLVTDGERLDTKARFRTVVCSALSWIVGYVGLFLAKWVIADKICGLTFTESLNGALFRLGNVMEGYEAFFQTYSRWDVFYTNWRHYEFIGYMVILSAWILWSLYHFFKNGWKIQPVNLPFLLVTCSSPVWYLLVTNHTTHHHFFTYRIYGASIIAFILFLCKSVSMGTLEAVKWKRRILKIVFVGGALCVGWGLSSLAKENVRFFFGEYDQELVLKEGDVYEIEFTPSFDNIKVLGFCMEGENLEEGYYHVELADGERICCELDAPLSEYLDYVYHESMIDWHLDHKKQYRMRISIHDNKEGVRLLLTNDGNKPLTEYGTSFFNGNVLDGWAPEPLCGIEYRTTVRSRLNRGYIALVCAAYLVVLTEGIISVVRKGTK